MKRLLIILGLLLLINFSFAKNVKFAVDMTGQTINVTGVHLLGNWQLAYIPMTQVASSTIYEVVVSLPAFQHYEYRFLNGDQSYETEFIPYESQAIFPSNDNRWLYIDSMGNDTTFAGAIRFSQNAPMGKRLIRFRVDMQNETVNSLGAHVAGNFQTWNTATTQLYSFDNKVYEYIAYVDSPSYTCQYKYVNGETSGDYETVPTACAVNLNRQFTVLKDTMLPVVCFAKCAACVVANGVSTISSAEINMYPNPASEQLTVSGYQLSENTFINIYDVVGRTMFRQKIKRPQSEIINTTSLQKGIYVVTINDAAQNSKAYKLVIE